MRIILNKTKLETKRFAESSMI